MKQHERRNAGGFPYFKLATFDPISLCFRDGKQAFPSVEAAHRAAKKPGRYRVSVVTAEGREDLHEFEPTQGGTIRHAASNASGRASLQG